MTDKTEAPRLADALMDATLDQSACELLFKLMHPNTPDSEEYNEVRLQWGAGHSGFGLYVSMAEYPEEGAELIARSMMSADGGIDIPLQATPPDQSDRIAALEAENAELRAANKRAMFAMRDMEAALETERMRLVACGVVALADTPESAASARQMHDDYRSASLTDVIRRVDECIALRAALEKSRRSEHNPFETDNQSEHYERLCAAPPAKPDFGSAAHALDDALVSAHLGTLESFPNPKAALKALEAWNDQLALDPAVSPEAAKLHERIAALEAERSALRTALEFASAAVEDAIYTEDGIDGQDGERLLYIFREALERGTFDKVRYGDLPPMLLEVRNNALEAALEQARVALESIKRDHWTHWSAADVELVNAALRAIEEMRK